MHMYQGLIVKQDNGKFVGAILRLNINEPNCDTILEHETEDEVEINVWLDDEMERLTNGKGVWEQ